MSVVSRRMEAQGDGECGDTVQPQGEGRENLHSHCDNLHPQVRVIRVVLLVFTRWGKRRLDLMFTLVFSRWRVDVRVVKALM